MKLRHKCTKEEFESFSLDPLNGCGPLDAVMVVDQRSEIRVFRCNVLEPVESWEEASRSSVRCEQGTVVSVFTGVNEFIVEMPDGLRLYWDGTRAVLQRRVR